MQARIFIRPLVVATVLALGLAGCGGDYGTGADANASAGSQPGSTVLTDSFFDQVSAIIATTSDTIEPVATDAITATAPETTEPTVLM